jgi:hypothetical protein
MPVSPEGVLPSGTDTLLTISGVGGFLYQARGLTQTLDVIAHSKQVVRTVNAKLIDISNPAFRKYESKIHCSDVEAPPLDNLWPGMEVTVHCAAELCYLQGNPGSPFKPEVSGSSYQPVGSPFIFYRPALLMRVLDVKHSLTEWKHDNVWSIDLEEV